MNRFFVNTSNIKQQEIHIKGEDVKHISKVLRLAPGDLVEICDGQGIEYICEISKVSKETIITTILHQRHSIAEPPIEITLYQGIPKGTKMDLIIQKTIEMGISEIIPVMTKRTVVQLEGSKEREKKRERWQKIAEEAAKQSKRGIIPQVRLPIVFKEALMDSQHRNFNLIAYEKESNRYLKQTLQELRDKDHKRLGIWIGPEGGYTDEEIQMAEKAAIHAVTLGPRILRTETAGFTLLCGVMYELGDLGG